MTPRHMLLMCQPSSEQADSCLVMFLAPTTSSSSSFPVVAFVVGLPYKTKIAVVVVVVNIVLFVVTAYRSAFRRASVPSLTI